MRRRLALLIFLALTLLAIDPLLLRDGTVARPVVKQAAEVPDTIWPGFAEFLGEVRRRTPRGASIAIVVQTQKWDEGYAFAFYRASYLLAGREVLPVVTPEGRELRENLARAQYVAVWNGRGGELRKRR